MQSDEDSRNEITPHPIKSLTGAVKFFWHGPCNKKIIIQASGKFKKRK